MHGCMAKKVNLRFELIGRKSVTNHGAYSSRAQFCKAVKPAVAGSVAWCHMGSPAPGTGLQSLSVSRNFLGAPSIGKGGGGGKGDKGKGKGGDKGGGKGKGGKGGRGGKGSKSKAASKFASFGLWYLAEAAE
eukprot:Skav222158  [mRNA]  locus=scaffold294:58481:60707:- [translate_table: standard]